MRRELIVNEPGSVTVNGNDENAAMMLMGLRNEVRSEVVHLDNHTDHPDMQETYSATNITVAEECTLLAYHQSAISSNIASPPRMSSRACVMTEEANDMEVIGDGSLRLPSQRLYDSGLSSTFSEISSVISHSSLPQTHSTITIINTDNDDTDRIVSTVPNDSPAQLQQQQQQQQQQRLSMSNTETTSTHSSQYVTAPSASSLSSLSPSLAVYQERSNEFVSSTRMAQSIGSRQTASVVSAITPTTTIHSDTSYCTARPFGCAYRQQTAADDADDDVMGHERQCTLHITNKSLIDEMIAKGTWDTVCLCMDYDDDNNASNNRCAISDPNLNTMDEMCLKTIKALNVQRVLIRHVDLIAVAPRKAYNDAVHQTSLTVDKILLSSNEEATNTGSQDAFDEAIKVVTALQQVKQTLIEPLENRVCEQLDVTEVNVQAVLNLHRRYKGQARHHRLPVSCTSN